MRDLIVNLMQSEYLAKKKQIKILVAGVDRSIDSLAIRLKAIQDNPDNDAGNFFLYSQAISSMYVQENSCIYETFTNVSNTFSTSTIHSPQQWRFRSWRMFAMSQKR